MGLRKQFVKAYDRDRTTAMSNVVVALGSWILDVILYFDITQKFTELVPKDLKIAYNLVAAGIVGYGYWFSQIAYDHGTPFLVFRIIVYTVYRLVRSILWCYRTWTIDGQENEPEPVMSMDCIMVKPKRTSKKAQLEDPGRQHKLNSIKETLPEVESRNPRSSSNVNDSEA
ncbi:hypothetical protein L596_006241 [Steinernema carpocapsae]|uniref:Uncharacterized protein n=1 Tax=Steinernema carpocapsae TaxID=34508 RepID=A0A4U8V1H2_STECR|nr:hypothetical protein L596_006241 [Steinernema carpocapsae]